MNDTTFQNYWYSIGGKWVTGCPEIPGFWSIGDADNGIEIHIKPDNCVDVKIFADNSIVLDSESEFYKVFQWLKDNLGQGYDWDTIIDNFPS